MPQEPRVPQPGPRRQPQGAPPSSRAYRRPSGPREQNLTRRPDRPTVESGPGGHVPRRRGNRRRGNRRSPVFSVIIVLLVFALLGVVVYLSTRNDLPLASSVGEGTAAPGVRDPEAGVHTTEQLHLSANADLPLSGKLILLDPGHGGTDSGAAYPVDHPTCQESEWNLAIAELTKESLERQGAAVILLREGDDWVSLYHRAALAHLYAIEYAKQTGSLTLSEADIRDLSGMLDEIIEINSDTVDSGGMGIMSGTGVGADLEKLFEQEAVLDNILYISIHCNSNEISSLHGTQVYYVTDDSVAESERRLFEEDPSYRDRTDFPEREVYYGRDNIRNAALAGYVYEGVISNVPQMETNTQSTVADNFAVLREHNLTGVLVEVGFISNSDDREMLADDTTRQMLAEGISNGILAFFADGN